MNSLEESVVNYSNNDKDDDMNDHDRDEEIRLTREEASLSVETAEEFISLTETNDVFYHYGEGYAIRAYIETEEQFIDFVQKVGIIHLWNMYVPFFVNDQSDFDEWFEYKDTVRTSDLDTEETISWGLDGDEECVSRTFYPTVKKDALTCTYNHFYDKPYRIRKESVMVYGMEDIKVKDEVKKKFPCVLTFISQDTFDRCGGIKGHSLSIISMADLTTKAVLA